MRKLGSKHRLILYGTPFSLTPPRESLLKLEFRAARISIASRVERKDLNHAQSGSAPLLPGKMMLKALQCNPAARQLGHEGHYSPCNGREKKTMVKVEEIKRKGFKQESKFSINFTSKYHAGIGISMQCPILTPYKRVHGSHSAALSVSKNYSCPGRIRVQNLRLITLAALIEGAQHSGLTGFKHRL